MRLIRWVIMLFLVGGSALAGAATFSHLGAQSFEHPEGIQLRQESTRSRTRGFGFFPLYARTHAHRGGGLSGGK